MPLRALSFVNFRNFSEIDLSLAPGVTPVVGPNGSGKTSILEGIAYLFTARSFRTARAEHLIKHGENKAIIRATVETEGGTDSFAVEISAFGRAKRRKNGQALEKVAEIAKTLPLQNINSDNFQLLEGGPKYRREFLDWMMFHVEPSFHHTWASYHRALKHRNALLKARAPLREIRVWSEQLAHSGEKLSDFRKEALRILAEYRDILTKIGPLSQNLTWEYEQGWPADKTLLECLFDGVLDEGFATSLGPHRADWALSLDGVPVRNYLSRGQIKLAALYLRIVASKGLKSRRGLDTLFLIDDLDSELDAQNVERALEMLQAHVPQYVVTRLDDRVANFTHDQPIFTLAT